MLSTGVHQPGKMHIQLGILKIMRCSKNVASRHIQVDVIPASMARQSALPISRASFKDKVQLAFEMHFLMLPAQSLLFSRLVQDRHRAGYPAYLKDKAPRFVA